MSISTLRPLRSTWPNWCTSGLCRWQRKSSRADWFLRHYPDSRYAVSALYIKGLALDLRVDETAFAHERKLRFHGKRGASFPAEASRRTWKMVLTNDPHTPMAAVALLRLASLDARAGSIATAIAYLNTLHDEFGLHSVTAPLDRGSVNTALTATPVETTLGVPLDETMLEAHHLRSLLTDNRDPLYGYQPIVEMLRFYARTAHYRENLRRLIARYPAAQITDNVELEIALATPELEERLALLEACIEHYPKGDALPEAVFKLGDALNETQKPAEARKQYERILRDFPDSIWAQAVIAHRGVTWTPSGGPDQGAQQ